MWIESCFHAYLMKWNCNIILFYCFYNNELIRQVMNELMVKLING